MFASFDSFVDADKDIDWFTYEKILSQLEVRENL